MRKMFWLVWLVVFAGCASFHPVSRPLSQPANCSYTTDLDELLACAMWRADSVFDNPDFKAALEAEVFLDGPGGGIVSGADVFRSMVEARQIDARVGHGRITFGYRIFGSSVSTIASTIVCEQVGINEGKIKTLAALVNTVAHERMHLLPIKGSCGSTDADLRYRYWDTPTDGLEPWLASYAVGDLVHCFALTASTQEAKECFERTVNGTKANRKELACSGKAEGVELVLRQRSARCQ